MCKPVERSKERAGRRYLRADEAPRLAAALEAESAKQPIAVACLRFLLHTGPRRGEVLAAQWRHIEGRVLTLPDSKNGDARPIHLSDGALAIIAALPQV